ncbi:MAG: Gfo/Idh/MocA family oxidoreductase [Thermoproteota archaeon]
MKAVSDIDENALKVAKTEFKVNNTYSSYLDLLDRKDIEAVIITTPPSTHAKIISDASKYGKHILCEKPFTTNFKEAQVVYSSIVKNKVKFQLGLVLRYTKTYNVLLNYLSNEVKLLGLQGRYGGYLISYKPHFDRTFDRGMVNSNTIHLIDIIHYLAGNINEVYVKFNPSFPKEPELSGIISFVHKNGLISNLYTSGAMRVESFLFVNTLSKDYLVESNIKLFEITDKGKTQILSSELGFEEELTAFYNYLVNGIPTQSGVEDAMKLSYLMEKVYESASKGKPVRL